MMYKYQQTEVKEESDGHRVQFVQRLYIRNARRQAPWAVAFGKVTGGFKAFECKEDFDEWKKGRG